MVKNSENWSVSIQFYHQKNKSNTILTMIYIKLDQVNLRDLKHYRKLFQNLIFYLETKFRI